MLKFRSLITRNPDRSMAAIGELKDVHKIWEWKVRDLSQLGQGYYHSHSVEYFDSEWWFGMQKTGNGITYVSLSRYPRTPGTTESVNFSIQCKTSDGEERGAVREQYPEKIGWALHFDPPWTIPSAAELTVTCSLRKGDSPHATGVSRETQSEGAGSRADEPALKAIYSLSEHFGKLLLSGTGHDVLIKVGDKEFEAHKHILEARSPVFAAMFRHDMAERAGDPVTIEDCDPDSFGQFLQFVYCGRADIASVGSALDLYHAGDKYDFPNLKKICVEFLKSSFTTTSVFEVVSLAARHDEKELLQRAIVYFGDNSEEVWRTVEWQRFLLANPIEANEMNLKASQCKSSLHKK